MRQSATLSRFAVRKPRGPARGKARISCRRTDTIETKVDALFCHRSQLPTTDEWFRGPLKEFVTETLLSPTARSAAWLDPKVVGEICRGHIDGSRTNGGAVWVLLNFELWMRRFLDAPPAQDLDTPRAAP